jgi:hypothetical protein
MGTLESFKIYIKDPNDGNVFFLHKTIMVDKLPAATSNAAGGGGYNFNAKTKVGNGPAGFRGESIQIRIEAHHRDGGVAVYTSSLGSSEVK